MSDIAPQVVEETSAEKRGGEGEKPSLVVKPTHDGRISLRASGHYRGSSFFQTTLATRHKEAKTRWIRPLILAVTQNCTAIVWPKFDSRSTATRGEILPTLLFGKSTIIMTKIVVLASKIA